MNIRISQRDRRKMDQIRRNGNQMNKLKSRLQNMPSDFEPPMTTGARQPTKRELAQHIAFMESQIKK